LLKLRDHIAFNIQSLIAINMFNLQCITISLFRMPVASALECTAVP